MTDRDQAISPAISPLRRRMIEDMTVRGFAPGTQTGYIRAVRNFTAFFGKPPDQASKEDLRRYQLHLRRLGTSATSMNAAASALRFFEVSLDRGEIAAVLTSVKQPQRIPVLLSPGEVASLLDHAPGLKARAALSLAYGAGLRASEVVFLRISDIETQRQVIRIEQGKGRKDRNAMLCEDMLVPLRAWWRLGREKGVIFPGGWLFPGRDPIDPLTARQLSRLFPPYYKQGVPSKPPGSTRR